MKKAEVREIIYETLRPVLAPSNFRLNKSQQAFVRDIACGTQHIGIPLWDYNPRFDFSLAMTMRIEAAEAITNRFSGSPPKYHSITRTVLTQLEHLGVRPCTWQAENEHELRTRLLEVTKIVQDRVIPFFDRYQELSMIAAAANQEPTADAGLKVGRSLFSSGSQPYRHMSAITLAHLARLENFGVLVLRYQKELSSLSQSDCDKFDQLVQFLTKGEEAV